VDHGNHSLDRNTQLALQRSFLATERTLMAWIRTSISMIGFGFTLAKLFQSLADSNVLIRGPAGEVWTAEGVGMLLISLGTFALVVAVFDHHRELKQLRAAGLEARFSLTMAVASVLAILGVTALLSVLVYT
jgi:putative membrane protein